MEGRASLIYTRISSQCLIGYQLKITDLFRVLICVFRLLAYLHMRETRYELDEALEHRHVADGDKLFPDVKDDLKQGGSVLVPKRDKSCVCQILKDQTFVSLLSQFDVGDRLILLVRTEECMEVI